MVILVTGAEGALGSAVTHRFASAGHEVVGSFHKTHPENKTVRWVQADLADPQSIPALVHACGARIDALIHCAGGYRWAPFEKTTTEEWNFLVNANLNSAFHVTREVLPVMKKQGFGRIVFVSAKQTLGPKPGNAAYTATKAGLNLFTLTLAEELRATGINVNAVLPSIIDTPANRKDMPDADFSTWVTTEELAQVIYSLTQPESKAITGALLPVAGRV
jgi:NAD(P)-dependent dehydrogenase (short-subunit alcohol dehydrogenase family)